MLLPVLPQSSEYNLPVKLLQISSYSTCVTCDVTCITCVSHAHTLRYMEMRVGQLEGLDIAFSRN